MSAEARIYSLAETAIKLAPAFRDKFDFSDEGHYDLMAGMAWKAAQALQKKKDQELEKILKTVPIHPEVPATITEGPK